MTVGDGRRGVVPTQILSVKGPPARVRLVTPGGCGPHGETPSGDTGARVAESCRVAGVLPFVGGLGEVVSVGIPRPEVPGTHLGGPDLERGGV